MDKKGVSEVVATLMIVLFVVVIAGIIWVVIRNVVTSNTEEIESGNVRIYLTIEKAYFDVENNENVTKVTVSRNSGEENVTGVRFIFFDGKDSYPVDRMIQISALGKSTFTFNQAEIGVPDIFTLTGVSVAPIYEVSGDEKIGAITNTAEITLS